MKILRFAYAAIALLISTTLFAKLPVGSLNCDLFFAPDDNPRTGMQRQPTPSDVYAEKLQNLATLVMRGDVDFLGLQEIGSAEEATALAAALQEKTSAQWIACFVQGRDTYTGENVAALVRVRPGLRLVKFERAHELDAGLSKHLVVTVNADGEWYQICVVHLIRPMNGQDNKHQRQLQLLSNWATSNSSGARIVVLGDFNDIGRTLLPLHSADALTGFGATHVSGREFDHIYSSVAPVDAGVCRPPYPPHPNNRAIELWSDHYLIRAVLP